MRSLIAIPYPAPSIPAQYRLYHGGSAKGGWLRVHDPQSWAYLGPYVYFSPRKQYAAGYVTDRHRQSARAVRDKQLFVIDARLLPEGSRVVTGIDALDSTESLFMDLIDTRRSLCGWEECLSRHGGRSYALLSDLASLGVKHEPQKMLADWLPRVQGPILCSDGVDGDPRALSPQALAALHRCCRDLGLEYVGEPVSLERALISGDFVKHRLNDGLLFALSVCGTLDLDQYQVRALLGRLIEVWLEAYSVTLDVTTLNTHRDRAALAASREIQDTGIHYDGHVRHVEHAGPGDIVLVPGPIRVLGGGWQGVSRQHTPLGRVYYE
jgi:hypothetical protein